MTTENTNTGVKPMTIKDTVANRKHDNITKMNVSLWQRDYDFADRNPGKVGYLAPEVYANMKGEDVFHRICEIRRMAQKMDKGTQFTSPITALRNQVAERHYRLEIKSRDENAITAEYGLSK